MRSLTLGWEKSYPAPQLCYPVAAIAAIAAVAVAEKTSCPGGYMPVNSQRGSVSGRATSY